MPDLALIATVAIFIATYAVVAVGKAPVYRIDRAGAALLGGSPMLAIGVLTPQEAYRAIDFDAITLLLSMMIVVANLRVPASSARDDGKPRGQFHLGGLRRQSHRCATG